MPYVTASEYARAEGISRQLVYKRIRGGKLTAREDGRIFREDDPSVTPAKPKKAKSSSRPKKAATPPAEDDTSDVMPIIGSAPMNYDQARTARLMIQARRDQIALSRLEGELVSAAEIEAGIADRVALLSNRLESLPVRFGRAMGLSDQIVRALEAALDDARRDFVDGLRGLIERPEVVDDDVAVG